MADEPLNLETRLAVIEGKLDELLASNKKTRKYLLWSVVVPLALLLLPLLAIPFVLPLLGTYLNSLTLPGSF